MITWNILIELSNKSSQQSSCLDDDKFLGWKKISKDEESKLKKIGIVVDNEGNDVSSSNEYHPDGTNYYSKNAPIALAYYPYNGCEVYQCSESGKLFLIYTEYGGHKPEKRCRLVQSDLIHI